MTEEPLNVELLPRNPCFGCGAGNPDGLHICVRRDPEDATRIVGDFAPRETMDGFPGIVHGGAIYTALDCMATWAGMILRGTKAIWVLRSATMKYHRPALHRAPIALSSVVESQGEEWEAIEVRGEARDAEGHLLAEGRFKVIPLPPGKFREIAGGVEIPSDLAAWLEDS